MKSKRLLGIITCIALVCGSLVNPALAWWDAGHMQIAYVGYKKLDAPVKDKVDALLRLNPDYGKWTAGIADPKTAKFYAFVHAATWADDIKTKEYNYTRDKVDSPTAGQNIGYADKNRHAYWHFKDVNWTPDGTPLPPSDPVDLVTQLNLMIAALPAASGASDDVRSCTSSATRINPCTAAAGTRGKFRTATPAAMPSR
jgi:S1/P1 Nuclease